MKLHFLLSSSKYSIISQFDRVVLVTFMVLTLGLGIYGLCRKDDECDKCNGV